MTLTPEIIQQLVGRPPKYLLDGNEPNQRELYRWLMKIYNLLGAPVNSIIYNIPDQILLSNDRATDIETELMFTTNNQQEIEDLRNSLNDILATIGFITNNEQDVADLSSKIDDTLSLLHFTGGNEQRLSDLEQAFQDNQTLYWMEA